MFVSGGEGAAARNVLDALEATFERLADHPYSARARPELGPDIRSTPAAVYRQYIVFYRPLAWGIEVIRVIHGARDIESVFGQS